MTDRFRTSSTPTTLWDYLRGLIILVLFAALGNGVQLVNPIPFPSPLVGLALLWLAIQLRIIQVQWFETAGNFLLRHMSLFFLPILLSATRVLPRTPQVLVATALTVLVGTLLSLWVTHIVCERLLHEVSRPVEEVSA